MTGHCVVIGGGPAGMIAGLLLARAGVRVTVLEKHADFLRDFRGDTVHPVTMRLLDELGLFEQFDRLPHSRVETGQFEILKNSIGRLSTDRRIQALLVAFAFGAFIEGASGFGTPVAICSALLIGLGCATSPPLLGADRV